MQAIAKEEPAILDVGTVTRDMLADMQRGFVNTKIFTGPLQATRRRWHRYWTNKMEREDALFELEIQERKLALEERKSRMGVELQGRRGKLVWYFRKDKI